MALEVDSWILGAKGSSKNYQKVEIPQMISTPYLQVQSDIADYNFGLL